MFSSISLRQYNLSKIMRYYHNKQHNPNKNQIMKTPNKLKVTHFIDIVNDNRLSVASKMKLLQKFNSVMHNQTNQIEVINFNRTYDYYLHQDNTKNPMPHTNIKIENGITLHSSNTTPNTTPNTTSNTPKNIEEEIKNMHEPIRSILLDYYTSIKKKGGDTDKDDKRLQWIKYVLKLPKENKIIDTKSNTKEFLNTIRTRIDNDIYGLDHVKDDLLSMIHTYIVSGLNQMESNTSKTIALLGSPGTGKTELVRQFAKYVDLPFVQISIGSVNDASSLIGHSYTYHGSQPGHIAKSVIDMKYKNGIIFLDEVDKLSQSHKGDEVLGVLMHLCDFTQNSTYCDTYLDGIPIDMSNYLYVYSMNSMDNISKPLLSRIGQNLIHVDDYTIIDKIKIAKNFILPKCLKEHNMDNMDNMDNNIILNDDVIKYIINTYCFNAKGVRELQGIIRKIIRIINYKCVIESESYQFPINVNAELVDKIMNKKNIYNNIHKYIL